MVLFLCLDYLGSFHQVPVQLVGRLVGDGRGLNLTTLPRQKASEKAGSHVARRWNVRGELERLGMVVDKLWRDNSADEVSDTNYISVLPILFGHFQWRNSVNRSSQPRPPHENNAPIHSTSTSTTQPAQRMGYTYSCTCFNFAWNRSLTIRNLSEHWCFSTYNFSLEESKYTTTSHRNCMFRTTTNSHTQRYSAAYTYYKKWTGRATTKLKKIRMRCRPSQRVTKNNQKGSRARRLHALQGMQKTFYKPCQPAKMTRVCTYTSYAYSSILAKTYVFRWVSL